MRKNKQRPRKIGGVRVLEYASMRDSVQRNRAIGADDLGGRDFNIPVVWGEEDGISLSDGSIILDACQRRTPSKCDTSNVGNAIADYDLG